MLPQRCSLGKLTYTRFIAVLFASLGYDCARADAPRVVSVRTQTQMDAVQLAAAFDALDQRFRLEAAAGTAQTLYAPTREAGVLLRHGLRQGLLPDVNGFSGLVAQWVAEDRRNRSGPNHRRYQPHDAERHFLDPHARALTLYADRHLAGVVDLPPGGLSYFNTAGLTAGQIRVRWVERAHALAACCGAIAARLRTGEWGPTFTEGWPTATGAVAPTVYSRDFRPLPADTARFDAIRDEIAAHPADYHEAGAWMETRYAPFGILAARAESTYRESDRFPAPEDRRNEPAWRLSCCAIDVREDRRSGALDLSALGDDQRLIMARRIMYLTWLVTDPDARERGVGVSALEAARWPAREDGVFGRAWVRGVAYLEPDLWRGLLDEAWRTIERHRRLNPDPPPPTVLEQFAYYSFTCIDILRAIVRGTSVKDPEPTPAQLREWHETGNAPALGMSPREEAVYRFRTETRPKMDQWLAAALVEARDRAGGAAGTIAVLLQEALEAIDAVAEAAVRVRTQWEGPWLDAEGRHQRVYRRLTELVPLVKTAPVAASTSAAPAPEPLAAVTLEQGPRCAHADDFTWIVWYGTKYDFAKGNQAESIKALWESWERSGRRDGCGLSEATIGQKCQSSNDNFRLAHVFRDHDAWGTVIRPVGKGVFALYGPASQENHTS